MAKRGSRVLRARKEERDDDSLLVRSAESLGRVIGSLQRQVQGRSKRLSSMTENAMNAVPELPELPRFDNLFGEARQPSRKRAGAAGTPKSKKTTRSAGTRKAAAARKTGSRKRAGSRKSSKKR